MALPDISFNSNDVYQQCLQIGQKCLRCYILPYTSEAIFTTKVYSLSLQHTIGRKERIRGWKRKEKMQLVSAGYQRKYFRPRVARLCFKHAKDTNGCVTQSITSSKPSLANSSSKLVSFQIQCFQGTCFISSSFMLYELLWTFFRLETIRAGRL